MSKEQMEDSTPDVAEDGATVGTGNSDRLAMLEAINDRNDQDRAEEMVELDDSGQVTKFVPKEAESELPLADPQDEEVTAKELQRMEDETSDIDAALKVEPPKYKLKVNGQEKEMTIDEIIAKAQKVEAADVYLAEAARLKKEAERSSHPVQQQPSPQDVALQQQEEQRALVRAIQMGTEEEAMAAIAKLQRPPPPSITPDEVARTIDERLTFKAAVSKFESEYQDILSDPVLKTIAFQKEQELMAQDPRRDYWSRYDEVGKFVREWKGNLLKANAPEPTQKAPAIDPNKQAKKAAATPVPKTASVKVPAPVVEDDSEESPSAVIAAMRDKRGGPQWMRN